MRRPLNSALLTISLLATVFGSTAFALAPNGGTNVEIVVADATTEDQKLAGVLAFVFKNESLRYGWPANYQSLWCPTNIFNLLKRLDQAHVDLSSANVWYILPQESVVGVGQGAIFPHAARPTVTGPVSQWSFHVVLEIGGRILDLDYTSSPHVASISEYAAVMWGKGPQALVADRSTLFVREIPARDYLAQYVSNWQFFESGGNGRYPAYEFSSLLPKASPSAH